MFQGYIMLLLVYDYSYGTGNAISHDQHFVLLH